jgi:hypothetical protein
VQLLPPPGPERRRQLTWLSLLALVTAAIAWYEFGRGTPPAETHQAASNPRANGAAAASANVLPEPVKLGTLTDDSGPPEPGRNLFRFGVHPPPPAPPAPKTPVQTGPPPPPPPPPGPPLINLRLIGLAERPDVGRVAELKDPTGALLYGLEGQILDGRYRLQKIGLESVIVSYLDGSGQRTLQLGR